MTRQVSNSDRASIPCGTSSTTGRMRSRPGSTWCVVLRRASSPSGPAWGRRTRRGSAARRLAGQASLAPHAASGPRGVEGCVPWSTRSAVGGEVIELQIVRQNAPILGQVWTRYPCGPLTAQEALAAPASSSVGITWRLPVHAGVQQVELQRLKVDSDARIETGRKIDREIEGPVPVDPRRKPGSHPSRSPPTFSYTCPGQELHLLCPA